jgi:malonate decarboxylase alpha subunit
MMTWQHDREARNARVEAGAIMARGNIVEARDVSSQLESVIRPGNRLRLDRDNNAAAVFGIPSHLVFNLCPPLGNCSRPRI